VVDQDGLGCSGSSVVAKKVAATFLKRDLGLCLHTFVEAS
jgi:hypothetical protein